MDEKGNKVPASKATKFIRTVTDKNGKVIEEAFGVVKR